MSTDKLISICIPTRGRPSLLKQALKSCFTQLYRPLEIIVGDDSEDVHTASVVAAYLGGDIRIDYDRNQPPRGQAGNVNQLFRRARGARLLLLHDDDMLLPGAIESLMACWDLDPTITAAFGKQQLISDDGQPLLDDDLNRSYYRTSNFSGTYLRPVESALLQQFPNDGFIVVTDCARRVGYKECAGDRINRWSDLDFAVRLAQESDSFYFLDRHTSICRLTTRSVKKHRLPATICSYMYDAITNIPLDKDNEWARERCLERLIPKIISVYAMEHDRAAILRVVSSRSYPARLRMTLTGAYHLALVASPSLVLRLRRMVGK